MSSDETHPNIRKRNRATLVCLPCRRKKIKCDKQKPCSNCSKTQPDKCIYDERILEDKKKKRKQADQEDNGVHHHLHHVISPPVEPKQDVCVLIHKSELEALQAKIKALESDSGSGAGSATVHTTQFDNDVNIVYNRAVDSYQNVVFSNHDEARPGFIPLENVSSERPVVYDSTRTVTTTLNIDELSAKESYLIGINPYNSSSDTIDFYDDVIPAAVGSLNKNTMSPLSWQYTLRNSNAIRALRCFAQWQREEESNSGVGLSYERLKKFILPRDEKVKSALHLDGSLETQFEARIQQHETDNLRNEKNPVNMATFALGLSILGGQKDRESSLIAQVKSVIPTKKVIWLLIKRYFKLMYAVIPYVIEDDFRHQVEKLIGPESYEDVKPDVKIDNQTDFAHVGILFIVCRLSFLSLFHNRGFYNEQILTKSELTPEEADRKHLILNAINIHIVDVAQACFLHLQRLGRIDFPLLQLGIYLRSYRVFAPEEGDGLDGGDSLNQHSNLLSMCYLLGLNRDPDIMSSAADEKLKHLYRKAWYYALMQEYTLAHTYGTPLYIRPESFDTKRPFMTEENANCRDIEIEKASLTVFAFISALIKGPIKDLILMCNNIGEPVKVSKLTGELNHLELGTFKLLGKVGDYVYTLEDEGIAYHSNKIMKTGILFKMNSLMIIMYCQLFNHYEKTNNRLAFFYFKKTLSLAINEMLPFMLPLITRSQELFGEAADLHINPNIITFLVRVIDVCLIATMRSNFSRLKMSNDPDHKLKMVTDTKYAKFFDSTNRLLLGMEKVCRVCLSACSVLSSRYYFAWAVMKSRTYYLKLVTTSKLYKMNEYEGLQFSRPSEDQLTELAALTERGLKKIESIIEQGCDAINISQLFKRTVPKRKPSKDYEREREPKPSSSSVSNHVSPSISFNEEVSTPQSVDSSGNGILYNTQFEDLKFDNSAEIDSIWLQMLNSKTFTQNDVFNVNPMTGLPDNGPVLNENFGYPVPNQFQPSSETIPTENTSANVNGAHNGANIPTNDQPTGMYFDFFDELPLGKLFNNL